MSRTLLLAACALVLAGCSPTPEPKASTEAPKPTESAPKPAGNPAPATPSAKPIANISVTDDLKGSEVVFIKSKSEVIHVIFTLTAKKGDKVSGTLFSGDKKLMEEAKTVEDGSEVETDLNFKRTGKKWEAGPYRVEVSLNGAAPEKADFTVSD